MLKDSLAKKYSMLKDSLTKKAAWVLFAFFMIFIFLAVRPLWSWKKEVALSLMGATLVGFLILLINRKQSWETILALISMTASLVAAVGAWESAREAHRANLEPSLRISFRQCQTSEYDVCGVGERVKAIYGSCGDDPNGQYKKPDPTLINEITISNTSQEVDAQEVQVTVRLSERLVLRSVSPVGFGMWRLVDIDAEHFTHAILQRWEPLKPGESKIINFVFLYPSESLRGLEVGEIHISARALNAKFHGLVKESYKLKSRASEKCEGRQPS